MIADKTRKIDWIDSLKGLAICGVVMVHSGVEVLPFPLGRLGCGGAYGVYIFFVLSACLAYYSLERTFRDREFTIKKIFYWWCLKIIRLVPLFYLAIVLYFPVKGNFSGNLGSNIITHILLVFGLYPQYINSILGVEWYLGILMLFYIMAPLFYKYVSSLRKASFLFVISFVLCEFVNGYALNKCNGNYMFDSFFGSFWIFQQLPSLSLGIILYYLLHSTKVRNIKIYQLFFIIVISAGIVLGRPFGIVHCSLLVSHTLCFVIAVCLSLLLNERNCCILNNVMWQKLGKYSYPIYLLHCLLLGIYDRIMVVESGNVFIDWGGKYVVTMIVALGISVLVSKYWDKPLQSVLRKVLI